MDKKITLFPLTMLIIGALLGGGVFDLMQNMATNAGPVAIAIAWGITALGMLSFVLVFQRLAQKRPDLKAGIFHYAQEGFGDYMGFNAAWGYWLSVFIGNVAYAGMLFSALSYFFPIFGDGTNIWSIVAASALIWLLYLLILKGVHTAAFVNSIITAVKPLVPILFILIVFFAFKYDIFAADIWGKTTGLSLWEQINSTMQTAVWVFTGIEGAVLFSGRAKHMKDVGRAGMLALFLIVLLYVLISILSIGVMSRSELADLQTPAMAYVLESVVGKWGAILVNIAVIISILGALLAWTLFASELPYQAALSGAFPRIFAKENAYAAPKNALLITTICIQIFLATFLVTDQVYRLGLALSTSAILLPYALTMFYQLKVSLDMTHTAQGKIGDICLGIVASFYACYLIYAGGLDYFLLTTFAYAIGLFVYGWMRKREGKPMFVGYEGWLALVIILLAGLCVYRIMAGQLDLGALLRA